MKHFIIYIVLCFILIFGGCSPKEFKPWSPPDIKYTSTEQYNIQDQLNKIKKPKKIMPRWVNVNKTSIDFVNTQEEATFILLEPKEYRKVAVLVKLAGTYKKIILDQEDLINMYIEQINMLKQQTMLERDSSNRYRVLWIETENFRRQQIHDLKTQSFYKDVIILLEGVGMIGILILAL